MKDKLKIYKSIFLLGTGLTLANTISYNLCVNGLNIKPFSNNEYDLYRTYISRYNKDGLVTTSKYLDKKLEDILIVKRENPTYFDEWDIINLSSLSKGQIDFIIQNIDNMELLTSDDLVKDCFSEDVVQNFDNYFLEYVHTDIDENDIKHFSSRKFDIFASSYYLTLSAIIFSGELTIYKSLENIYKPTKKLKRGKNRSK